MWNRHKLLNMLIFEKKKKTAIESEMERISKEELVWLFSPHLAQCSYRCTVWSSGVAADIVFDETTRLFWHSQNAQMGNITSLLDSQTAIPDIAFSTKRPHTEERLGFGSAARTAPDLHGVVPQLLVQVVGGASPGLARRQCHLDAGRFGALRLASGRLESENTASQLEREYTGLSLIGAFRAFNTFLRQIRSPVSTPTFGVSIYMAHQVGNCLVEPF